MLLALIDKGLGREDAYKIVQHNSSRVLDEGVGFREALEADAEVSERLTPEEIDVLFDHSYYVRYVDDTFERAGLA